MKKILAVTPCFSMILLCTSMILLCTGILSSCKPDAPSVLKIFIRSANNELLEEAEVIIIGDPKSNPPTGAYVDTLLTNSSGYAEFNLEPYFSGSGTGSMIAYFDVIAKSNLKNTTAYVRCRKNITSVETMYLMN